MKVLGVTGGVGAGKSTLLAYMRERYGAVVLELDKVAADLQRKGGRCYAPMAALLGEQVLGPDGELDRGRVAARLFQESALRSAVNRIVHPAVKERVREQIRAMGRDRERSGEKEADRRLLVIEAALLLEDHYETICNRIWYIYADEQTRVARLMASRGYTQERCRAIMASQHSDEFFRQHTDRVIDNSGPDPAAAFEQIDEGIADLWNLAQ